MTWDCPAYGAEGTKIGALCFFAPEMHSRLCGTEDECRGRLAVERVRLFTRIEELRAEGNEVAAVLNFTHPEQLLGGSMEPPAP